MNFKQPYDGSAEPRWVTQIVRLFPHPIFAAVISIACGLVASIFTLAALTGGPWALCAVVAIVFATGAYFVAAATIVRRRHDLRRTRLQRDESTVSDSQPAMVTDQHMKHDDPFNNKNDHHRLSPIPTWKLLLYLSTVLVWEVQVAVALLRILGGIQIDPFWRFLVLGLFVIVTLLAVRFGRHDFRRIQKSGGNVELTGKQAGLVAVIFVSLGGTVAVVFAVLRDEL